MSRQEVLVDADWVAEHTGDENIVLVEVDESGEPPRCSLGERPWIWEASSEPGRFTRPATPSRSPRRSPPSSASSLPQSILNATAERYRARSASGHMVAGWATMWIATTTDA